MKGLGRGATCSSTHSLVVWNILGRTCGCGGDHRYPSVPTAYLARGPGLILGYEDAIGFDAVWVLGASGTVVPPEWNFPFLPLELQVAAGIPGASSEGALARAEKVVAGLLVRC